jgi:hypothetical protein
VLNGLIDKGLADAPDIAAANARIAQARAGLAANKTALIPTLNVSGAVPYVNVPSNILGGNKTGRTDTTIYNVGFDSSWELDLFGGTRSKIAPGPGPKQPRPAPMMRASRSRPKSPAPMSRCAPARRCSRCSTSRPQSMRNW